MTELKACRGCDKNKPVDAFARKGKYRASRCKECLREWAARYRSEHGDRVNENARVGYAKDPTKKKTSKAAYAENHREAINARRRARFAEVYPTNPGVWRACIARRKQRLAVNMDAMDRALSAAYRNAIHRDPCCFCRRRTAEMHVDHYVPLAKGGTDHWWNLVRACADCNLSKKARCGTWFALRVGSAHGSRPAPAVA